MNLKKYEGKEVEIITIAPTMFSSWTEERGDTKVTVRESGEDNAVGGLVVETSSDSLTVEFDQRGRTYRYEVHAGAIAMILTSKLNETGKAQSERMKAQHQDAKK